MGQKNVLILVFFRFSSLFQKLLQYFPFYVKNKQFYNFWVKRMEVRFQNRIS